MTLKMVECKLEELSDTLRRRPPHLSFLTLMTDMMTSRLPKMAAMMINIIIDAVKTAIKTLIHSCLISSSVVALLLLLQLFLIVVLKDKDVATVVARSFIVSSLLNGEEDNNFGDVVWDDMSVSGLNFLLSFLLSFAFGDFLSCVAST